MFILNLKPTLTRGQSAMDDFITATELTCQQIHHYTTEQTSSSDMVENFGGSWQMDLELRLFCETTISKVRNTFSCLNIIV